MIVTVRTVTGGVQRCKVYDSQDITSFAALACGRPGHPGKGLIAAAGELLLSYFLRR